ncbi:hypothetical protein [Amycolatopsis vastitatis]|uniref:hypothetical protein n=1 Tax=Amycolatopsis vastitatis TaxID=1905142 RepID=UPI001F0ABDAC|nr:hypothetical protein [Amycolatopsis vastitatis]
MSKTPARPAGDALERTEPVRPRDERLGKVLTTRAIVLAGPIVAVVAAGTLWLPLALFGAGTPADQAQLDVFRATGNVVLGAGGAVALLLAATAAPGQRQTIVNLSRDPAACRRARRAHRARSFGRCAGGLDRRPRAAGRARARGSALRRRRARRPHFHQVTALCGPLRAHFAR